MKKTLSLVTVLALVLSLASVAFAGEAWLFEEAGITLNVPQGLTAVDVSEDADTLILEITDPSEANVVYFYSVEYDDAYAGKWSEDLTQAELETALSAYAYDDGYVYDVFEADGVIYSVMASSEGDVLHVVVILNGWFCSVTALAADGYALGDGAVEDAINILAGVAYAE